MGVIMRAADVVTLVGLDGVPVRSLSARAHWVLEERSDSTNRLTVDVPLSDAAGVTSDMELLLGSRRYKIAQIDRSRASSTATVTADEAQVELADWSIASLSLDGATLANATAMAVAGTMWSPGTSPSGYSLYAALEGKTALECLNIFAGQTGLVLRFDSINRMVSFDYPNTNTRDRVFTYAAGLDGVEKTEVAPAATVIYPYGADGMTIAGVNAGVEYLEDFSWYTSLGLSLEEARERFTKRVTWTDERYIYPANLLTAAQAKLDVSAHPQISYTLKPSIALKTSDLVLGDRVWVVDETLDMKLAATVTAITRSSDGRDDEIGLEYLPPTSATADDTLGDSTAASSSSQVKFQAKNTQAIDLSATHAIVLAMDINVYAATDFEINLSLRVEHTAAGLLDGYFLLDGEQLDPLIMETCDVGWVTVGLPVLQTQVQPGAKTLRLYLSSSGSASVPAYGCEMYVRTSGAYGGLSNGAPAPKATDAIDAAWIDLVGSDAAGVVSDGPLRVSVADTVGAFELTVTDTATAVADWPY